MEEIPSLNIPVQRLKVAILPLDLTRPGPVTHSGKILTTDKSHGKKPDRFSLNDDTDVKNVSRFKYASLVKYINSTNIPPIMIINRIYGSQNLLSL